MSEENKEDSIDEEVLEEDAVQQAWWRESAFVKQFAKKTLNRT